MQSPDPFHQQEIETLFQVLAGPFDQAQVEPTLGPPGHPGGQGPPVGDRRHPGLPFPPKPGTPTEETAVGAFLAAGGSRFEYPYMDTPARQ